MSQDMTSQVGGKKKGQIYLIITNISKSPNIKSLLRTAVAFGCHTIFIAGQRKFNFDHQDDKSDIPSFLKSSLNDGALKIVKFEKLEECIQHVHSLGIQVAGVEIDEKSVDIEDCDDCFIGDTAFMMGNEGDGMNKKQLSLCDTFVKIRQYGGGTASLNVNVAAGIVLHRFHQWAMS
mmetsp:Transcript_15736/g.19186  ORF Transcript_15736/g.19186 Transcript_15736/m.19186 type:complete len:177 (-) Transcript_15736:28-558(-)